MKPKEELIKQGSLISAIKNMAICILIAAKNIELHFMYTLAQRECKTALVSDMLFNTFCSFPSLLFWNPNIFYK